MKNLTTIHSVLNIYIDEKERRMKKKKKKDEKNVEKQNNKQNQTSDFKHTSNTQFTNNNPNQTNISVVPFLAPGTNSTTPALI